MFKLRARGRVVAAGPNCFGVDWLEPRHLLAASSSPIVAVQPYNGAVVSQSPQEVVITFDGVSVPAFMGSNDLQIDELNGDGTKTPLWSFDDPPPEESDDSGTELIVPIQTFNSTDFAYENRTLPAGNYEIDLLGGTGLSYAASGALGPGPQLWDPDQDHAIGTFTVVGQGATLGSASSLGVIGPIIQTARVCSIPTTPKMRSTFTNSHCPKDTSGRWAWRSSRTASGARSCPRLRSWIRMAPCWRHASQARGCRAIPTTLTFSLD